MVALSEALNQKMDNSKRRREIQERPDISGRPEVRGRLERCLSSEHMRQVFHRTECRDRDDTTESGTGWERQQGTIGSGCYRPTRRPAH